MKQDIVRYDKRVKPGPKVFVKESFTETVATQREKGKRRPTRIKKK